MTAEIQQTNHSLQRQVKQLQQQLSQQSLKLPWLVPPPSLAQVRGGQLQVYHKLKPHPSRVGMVTLNWTDGGRAPSEMSMGAALVNGNVAYFLSLTGEVCSYNSADNKWSTLFKCPYQRCRLTVVNSQFN